MNLAASDIAREPVAVLGAGSWGTALAIQFARAGLAAATTAGNAAAVPAIVASANPAYAEAAASATVLVAASVIVTALCAPPLTIWWAGRKSSAESHE